LPQLKQVIRAAILEDVDQLETIFSKSTNKAEVRNKERLLLLIFDALFAVRWIHFGDTVTK